MIQIKTIASQYSYDFDKRVNEALADGWQLIGRYTAPDNSTDFYFVAELEKEVETEKEPETHYCKTCAHREIYGYERPCCYCIGRPGLPKWEPKA